MDDERYIVERRLTERVFRYWQDLCRGRAMPEEADIDPELLGEDWPHCFLLQTRDIEQIEQFNFTYLGEAIAQRYQESGIDPDNLCLVGPNAFYLAPLFKQVVQTREPLIDAHHFETMDGRKIYYRQCLLPLGTKNRVEAIFGSTLFKVLL